MINYSAIIVTYNRINLLKECIECTLNQTVKPSYILIIDNCSSDGTREYLEHLDKQNGEIIVHHLSENIGGSGGFSFGIEEASKLKTDYYLLYDDDAMLNYDFVEKIEPYIDKNILAYSGTVIQHNKILNETRRNLVDGIRFQDYSISDSLYSNKFFDCDLASFCGLLISKEIVERVGLPRGDFFIWYDDTEYSLRFRNLTKIRNVCDAILVHKVPVTQPNVPNPYEKLSWKTYYGYRNMLVAIKSNMPFVTYIYQIMRFRKQQLKYFFHLLIDKESTDNMKYNIGLINDVLKDESKGIMNKNRKYLP